MNILIYEYIFNKNFSKKLMNCVLSSQNQQSTNLNKNKNDEISPIASLSNEQINHKSINNIDNNSKIISKDIKTEIIKINYGKIKVLKFDKNNDPLFVLGPDYIYFFLIIFLDILVVIFLAIVQYCYSTIILRIIGLLLSFIQLIIYIYCSIKNPGFPKRAFQDPSLLNIKDGYYRRCKECEIIVDLRKFPGHCYNCKFCCEGFDHHCSWTTKCIGSGNIKEFRCFLGAFFILIFYFCICAIWFEPSRNKCRINFF